jgi:hypothetical protein
MMGTLALLASFSTSAQAKKAHKLKMDPTVASEPEPTGPVPPEADAAGHVNYGNPQAEGVGRVTVKSTSGDKIQVYLEGRYFGDTPVTIYSVPKGDYIVEGTIVSSGKSLSRPVSVSENEEATVELGGGKIETPPDAAPVGGGLLSGAISPRRKHLTEAFVVAAAVGVVGAIVFGIYEHGAVNDFNAAPPGLTPAAQANLDSISRRGNRDAELVNVGLIVAGFSVIGAVVAGYPMFNTHHDAEKPAEPATALIVAPIVGAGTTGGALSFRF